MAGYRTPRDHGYGFAKIGWSDRNPYPYSSSANREFLQGVKDWCDGEPRPNGDVKKKVFRDRDWYDD